MHISAYILPRRVILTFLIVLGLFLRLWGLSWPAEAYPGASPEWGEAVITNISWFNLVYREHIWTQAVYSLAFVLKSLFAGLAGWLEVWLGQTRISPEEGMQGLLAGRLAVALLGTGQIWLAYQVGRRWFNSVGTGLLCAAWLAVSPLMVMESHYLAAGVPLGFMALLCMWAAYVLARHFKPWHFLLAGFCLGLTVTVKASGIIITPLFLWAAVYAWRQQRPGLGLGALWTFCALLGLWMGLTIGSPGFVLQLFRMHNNVWESLALPPLCGAAGMAYVQTRVYTLWELMQNWVGWHWLALWLLAFAIMLKKKYYHCLAIALFPLLYVAAALFLLASPMENLLAACMPMFILMAVWPIVVLCRRIPGRLTPAWTVALIGALLLAHPLLNSFRVGYLFWQQPTLSAALAWAEQNLPASPGLAATENKDYLLLPSALGNPNNLQLMKSFDLVSDWAPTWLYTTCKLATPYNLYGNTPSLNLKESLNFSRLPVGSRQPFSLVFADNNTYSRDESAIVLDKPGAAGRMLRIPSSPVLNVKLRNMGNSMAMLQLNQGPPWKGEVLTLYPGQERSLKIRARNWPPMMGGTYPLGLRLHQGNLLWASWQWNPATAAYQDLLSGRQENALSLPDDDLSFESKIMRLLAFSREQNWEQAQALFNSISPNAPAFALARQAYSNEWKQTLANYAGVSPKLLQTASRVFYPIEPLRAGQELVQVHGQGFSGVLERRLYNREGWLKLKLNDILPAGLWRFNLYLKDSTPEPLTVQLWHVDVDREFLLKEAIMPAGASQLELAFSQLQNAAQIEARVEFPSSGASVVGFALETDIYAHMRQIYNWYLEAACRLNLQQGHFTKALQAINAVSFPLAPELLYLKTRALWGAGLNHEALRLMHELQALWHNNPEKLSLLRDMYQSAGEDAQLQELDRRLAELRPSISKNAIFSNYLALLGYDGPGSGELKAGGKVSLNLYWQALQTPTVDTAIVLKLLGPDTNIDFKHRLSQGAHKMTQLREGQLLRETRALQLPANLPPGSYQLRLSLLDSDYTNQLLPIRQGEGRGGTEMLLFNLEIK